MKECINCGNFVPIGEGDHICIYEDKPVLVVDSYQETDEYMHCNGKNWERIR